MITTDARPLFGVPCVVFDFETTGVDATNCQPVSVAVVRVELGVSEPEPVFSSLIRVQGHIPEEATAIHGITDADVADAPLMTEVARMIEPLFSGAIPVAYNLPFDWRIFKRWWPTLPWGGLDPLVWVRTLHRYDRGPGRHKLETIAAKYGLDLDAHDARSDALVTARLMPLLLPKLVRHKDGPRGTLDGGRVSVADLWTWQLRAALRGNYEFAMYCTENLDRCPPDLSWHDVTREHWADIAPEEDSDD